MNFKHTTFKSNSFKVKQKSVNYIVQPIEDEMKKEINNTGIRMKEQSDRMKMNCDTEYFSVIYFTCKKDRDDFLKKSKFGELTSDSQYLNGYKVAEKMGLEITKTNISKPKPFKVNKNLLSL